MEKIALSLRKVYSIQLVGFCLLTFISLQTYYKILSTKYYSPWSDKGWWNERDM